MKLNSKISGRLRSEEINFLYVKIWSPNYVLNKYFLKYLSSSDSLWHQTVKTYSWWAVVVMTRPSQLDKKSIWKYFHRHFFKINFSSNWHGIFMTLIKSQNVQYMIRENIENVHAFVRISQCISFWKIRNVSPLQMYNVQI